MSKENKQKTKTKCVISIASHGMPQYSRCAFFDLISFLSFSIFFLLHFPFIIGTKSFCMCCCGAVWCLDNNIVLYAAIDTISHVSLSLNASPTSFTLTPPPILLRVSNTIHMTCYYNLLQDLSFHCIFSLAAFVFVFASFVLFCLLYCAFVSFTLD